MRRFLCILCSCLLLAVLTPTALAAGLTASVSTEPVTLNGVQIDNRQAKYPLLVYRDITYFPMTYHLCRFLGVSSDWDGTTLYIDRTGDAAEYTAETSSTRQKGSVTAVRVSYPVVINGTAFDSKNAKWPLLNYRDVTYFPLTWALAAEELGWDYRWDAKNGLRIDSGTGSDERIVEDGGTGSDEYIIEDSGRGDGEMMNAASRRIAGVVWSILPEDLTVELWDDWSIEGIKGAIQTGMADYVNARDYSALDGNPPEIQISYEFQLPAQAQAGMECEVPFTAVFSGEPVILPSGNTFTPTGKTTGLTATVRLRGQGETSVDSTFQAEQAVYRRLKTCVELGEISVRANSDIDVSGLIGTAVREKLNAAGLADQYIIQAMLLGPHTTILGAGKAETVEFTVVFRPQSTPGNDMNLTGHAVFQAKP